MKIYFYLIKGNYHILPLIDIVPERNLLVWRELRCPEFVLRRYFYP